MKPIFPPSKPFGGLCVDFYIGLDKETDDNWVNPDLHYFRLTYTYFQPHFEYKYTGYEGNMHSITLGYVLTSQPRWRIK